VLTRLAAATAAVLVPATSLAADRAPVKVLPTAGPPKISQAQIKPEALEWLMTGDYLTGLRWHRWAERRATARGTYHLNRCDPSCGGGPYVTMRGQVTLSHIVTCHGVRLYTRATARYLAHHRWRKATGLGEPPNPCGS
jgi:hypothetical protein